MNAVSSILEVLGVLAVVAGVALFDWRAGVIALGVAFVLFGYIVASPRPVPAPEPVGRPE